MLISTLEIFQALTIKQHPMAFCKFIRVCIDLFEYIPITSKTLENGLEVIRKSFFVDENACIAVNLQREPNAAIELEELCVRTALDGISVIAIDRKTGQVVGVSFNKLQVKSSDDFLFFKEFISKCKYPSSKALIQFMIDADSVVDLFDLCQVNCLLEIMFIAVLKEYRGRGIAPKLFEMSMNIGKELLSGKNVKVSVTDDALPLEPVPKAACAILTSIYSQTLIKKLNLSIAADISYKKFTFEGESFANRIGSDTPSTQVVYKLF
ncbi:hypothetical protein FQR65_LT10872 [Abscondita terminalis]|nr:hypothetical protein FQR65_LT10872 [Abscondita terminalis]